MIHSRLQFNSSLCFQKEEASLVLTDQPNCFERLLCFQVLGLYGVSYLDPSNLQLSFSFKINAKCFTISYLVVDSMYKKFCHKY